MWQTRIRSRIGLRLAATHAAIIVVAVIPCIALLLSVHQDSETDRYQGLTDHSTAVNSAFTDAYKNTGSFADADAMCIELSTNIEARVQLFDADHRLISDSDKLRGSSEEDGSSALRTSKACLMCHPEARRASLLSFELPLTVSHRLVGYTRVSKSRYPEDQSTGRTRRIIIVTLAASAILAGVFSRSLSRAIAGPIKNINTTAKQMAQGNLGERANVPNGDELGHLAGSFNAMADQIEMMITKMSEEKSKMEMILATMADGIVVMDESGTIVLFNRAAERMLDMQAASMLGANITTMTERDDLVEMMMRTAISRETSHRELQQQDVAQTPISAYCSPIVADNSKCMGTIAVLHDLTQSKSQERAQKEFVANVSHELRTPITAVRTTAEALLSGAKDDPKLLDKFLTTMIIESDRLSMLINDLLDIVKRDAGSRQLRYSDVDLRALANRVCMMYRPRCVLNEISLHNHVRIPSMWADEQQLEQVLTNLLDNAIKYTSAGGTVTISDQDDENSCSIIVTDTGMGMSQNEMSRIFERFYRVDKARSRKIGGTGLGLSIVKDIVNAHNGNITVNSKPGEGTVFTVTLPKTASASSEEIA